MWWSIPTRCQTKQPDLFFFFFFNSLFCFVFFFFEWPLCVGGSRAFWPTPKMFSECSLWLTWCCVPFWHACRSREWFLCVCVCPYFYFIFFDFVLRFFLFNFEREKNKTKTWPLKKEKKMMVVAAVVMWKRGWNCTSWGFCAFDGYDQIGGGHLLFIPLSRRAIRTSRFPPQPPCIHEPANARRRSERSTVHSLSNQLTVQCMHLKCIT